MTTVRLADLSPGDGWGEHRKSTGRRDSYFVLSVHELPNQMVKVNALHSTCGAVSQVSMIFLASAVLNIRDEVSK